MKKESIRIDLGEKGYDVNIGSSLLSEADKLFDLDRRVVVVTDSGVPSEYAKAIASLCREAKIVTFPEGETNKNLDTYAVICKEMLDFELQRKDAVVAVVGAL